MIAEAFSRIVSPSVELGYLLTNVLAQEAAAPAQELTFVEKLFANPLLPIIVIIFFFYTMLLAPERRRKAEEAKLMASLKKNDRIVTVGGIHGTVVSISPDSDVVTIRVDESGNTRLKINRTAISTVVKDPKESDRKDADSSTKN
ncbi:preprotein translocase subunit YajC [Novipirellula artificiosorum]|uniref:preprotein translocase subunit YajC n=1 Tax=Novipirellula artificiosorum TaxID=2528016 RepID=UPI001E616BAF|nr:preprotein translocase subunit YajC [Novipirellula artificiosorum]